MRLPEDVYLKLGFSHDQFEQAMLLVQQLGSNQAADQAMGLPQGTVARWAKLWIKAQHADGRGVLDDGDELGAEDPTDAAREASHGSASGSPRESTPSIDSWRDREGSALRPRSARSADRRELDDSEDALRAFRRGAGNRSGLSRFAASLQKESTGASFQSGAGLNTDSNPSSGFDRGRTAAARSGTSNRSSEAPPDFMNTTSSSTAQASSADRTTLEQRNLALSRLDEVAQGLRKLSEVSERAVALPKSSGDEEIRAMLKLATSMMEFMAKQQEQFLERIQGLEEAQRQMLGRSDPSLALGARIDELSRNLNALSTMDQVVRVREEVADLRDLLEEVLRLVPRLKDSAREVVRLELGEQSQGLGDRLGVILRQHADAMIESDARMPGALAEVLDAQWNPMFSRLIETVDAGFRSQALLVAAFRSESERREQESRLLLQELKQALDRREESLRHGLEQQAQAQIELARAMHQEDQNRMSQLVDSLAGLGRQISQSDQRLASAMQQQANEYQRLSKEHTGVLQQQGFEIKSMLDLSSEIREALEGLRHSVNEFGGSTTQSNLNQRLQKDLAQLQRDLDALQSHSQARVLL